MVRAKRSGKINRHERITQILLSGNPTTPEEILQCLQGTDQEKVGYRISTNIYNIRLDGGVIKVHKDGRKVKAYQLMNPQEFNAEGRYIGRKVATAVAPARPTVTYTTVTEDELEIA